MAHPFGTLPARFEPDVEHLGEPVGVAFVAPGRSYSPSAPLLETARRALLQHGWIVQQLWWDAPDYDEEPDETGWVCDQVAAALAAETSPPARVLVAGKSLGTLAASYVARHSWPAIWLTPLLTDPDCVGGLRDNPGRQLLVRTAEIHVEVARAADQFLRSLEAS